MAILRGCFPLFLSLLVLGGSSDNNSAIRDFVFFVAFLLFIKSYNFNLKYMCSLAPHRDKKRQNRWFFKVRCEFKNRSKWRHFACYTPKKLQKIKKSRVRTGFWLKKTSKTSYVFEITPFVQKQVKMAVFCFAFCTHTHKNEKVNKTAPYGPLFGKKILKNLTLL